MVENNLNWLRQIRDDLVLHSNFHNVVKNPALLVTILEDTHTHTHTSLPVPSHNNAFNTQRSKSQSFSIPMSTNSLEPYLEQWVIFEESADYFAGLFWSF